MTGFVEPAPIDYSGYDEAALRRLLKQRDHQAALSAYYWTRAAKEAFAGNPKALELRVNLAEAPPVDITLSGAPPPDTPSTEASEAAKSLTATARAELAWQWKAAQMTGSRDGKDWFHGLGLGDHFVKHGICERRESDGAHRFTDLGREVGTLLAKDASP